jgi:hypothetical protein
MNKSKGFLGLVAMLAVLAAFIFTATATAQRVGGGNRGVDDWVIMTYVPDNNFTFPVPLPVTKSKSGVAFDFYPTPDRAMLLASDMDTLKQFHEGNLSGKRLTAKISIEATLGATFNHYNNDSGLADPGGYVRLYFQTGVTTGWNPADYEGNAQYWWSNPIHIDLEDLAARGKKGITLQVPLDPDSWSDRDGHMGTDAPVINGTLYDHTLLFNQATAQVTKVGLSFGGGSWWAFGCGVDEPSTAVFKLEEFKVKK